MSRHCDHCSTRKCNKIYRIPIGTPVRKIFYVCGKCVIHNAQELREWLNKKETELK